MHLTVGIRNLVDLLRQRAEDASSGHAYTFLNSDTEPCDQVTYAELDSRARLIGERLQRLGGVGERAVLLYPPGLSFIQAFFGVLYAGWMTVPAYPPTGSHNVARLQNILQDARPKVILTSGSLLAQVKDWCGELPGIQVMATDILTPESGSEWRAPALTGSETALLQYTSGSISTPRGVVVTHRNLLNNEETIRTAFSQSSDSITVSWLPVYHDMGLIGGVLQPLYTGSRCILLAPVSFLQSPRNWLETISRYKATTSGGPNFAYDLCVRRIAESDCADLDLSSWAVAFNGAEPIHAQTLKAFADKFERFGFRRRAFFSCYGLAEATLFVAGGSVSDEPVISKLSSDGLQKNRVRGPKTFDDAVELVGCGHPRNSQAVVVNPRTRRICSSDSIGEIWIAGETVAQGYWNQPKLTQKTFRARLSNRPKAGPYLRTGDLGFCRDGELFITGRLKDMVIIRGRNYYPQDLELTAETSHSGVRPHSSAAFSVPQQNEEALIVVCEIAHGRKTQLAAIADAVRRTISETHEIFVADVVLVRPGGVAKTSSGKIQRLACRAAYLKGSLPVMKQSRPERAVTEPRSEVRLPKLTRTVLIGLSAEKLRSTLVGGLRHEIARNMGVPAGQIDDSLPLTALGLDSLAAVQLSHSLIKNLQVSMAFSDLMRGPSVMQLADMVAEKIETAAIGGETSPTSRPREDGSLPLSYGQRALWFLHRLAPESSAYNIAAAVRLHSPIDVSALHRAFALLVSRHAALRTEFFESGGEPAQRIHDEAGFEFRESDASAMSEAEIAAELEFSAARPFTLREPSLLRVNFYRRPDPQSIVQLVVHHIVSDFWSMAVLAREIGELYRQESGGGAAALEPPGPAYWQYAAALREKLSGVEGERLQDYWTAKLRNLSPYMDLPCDKPRPRVQTFKGDCFVLEIDGPLTECIQQLSRIRHTSLFVSLLAAFHALLHRYSGQQDLAVGSVAIGRPAAEHAGTVGYFANPVVLRADMSGRPTFDELLQQTQNVVIEAMDHQEFPFPLLVERLKTERDAARSPLFQTAFVFQKAASAREEAFSGVALGVPGLRFQLGDLLMESIGTRETGSQFDLTLRAAEINGRLFCSFLYNTDLFEQETIQDLARHYRNVLEQATARPGQLACEIELLSKSEREQILHGWNAAEVSDDSLTTVHALFEDSATRTPDAIAVVCGDQYLSYGELNRRANSLARKLKARQAGMESRVALCMGRSPEMVIAMLATLKAGAAYVPINPEYPQERQEFMLTDSAAEILITETGATGLAKARIPELTVEGAAGDERAGGEEDLLSQNSGSIRSLAWIIYTSGSTGLPKGAGIEHRSAAALLSWAREAFTDEEMRGVLASTSWCFDLSAFEIWAPLSRGGTTLIVDNLLQLPSMAASEQVRLVNSVPSAVQELIRQNAMPGNVVTVNLAGEALSRSLAEKLQALGHVRRVLNLYGPTEDTTYSTWAEIDRDVNLPAIGQPIQGSRAYVLDDRGEPLPPGVVGELYLSGTGLARGYVGRPDLTAEKFVPDPFSTKPGERSYRTGDRVRRRRNGDLEYHGRADQQIKLRGFRIELEEVEICLERSPGVRESAVGVRRSPSGDPQLVGYLVLEERSYSGGVAEVRSYLQRRLPVHMIPVVFLELVSLPRTSNGKVDRGALPEPEWGNQRRDVQAPRTATEETVAAVWRDVLGRESIGVNEDFFELGGHSLLATRIVSRLRELFNIDVPLRRFFENSTVEMLAKLIEEDRGIGISNAGPELIPQDRPQNVPLSFAQERIWFLEQLEPEGLAYNVPGRLLIEGAFCVAAARQSFAEIVRRHESLRTTFQVRENAPIQRIHPGLHIALPVIDLRGLDQVQQQAEIQRIGQQAALQAFDLENGPLLRLHLLRLGDAEHVLLMNLHHIICDGWSFGVMAREFRRFYQIVERGEAVSLPDPPIQYADYALWQRQSLTDESLAEHLRYWKEKLAGLQPLNLPLDRIRPAVPSTRGEVCRLTLDAELVIRLKHLCHGSGATLFMALLASWQATLSRYCRQFDVPVGTPIAGRTRRNTEDLIGCLVNTLVLRCDLEGSPRFDELLARVRDLALEAYAHQELPFEKLVENLQPDRASRRTPLFEVSFTLQNTPLELSGEGLRLSQIALNFDRVKFDLALALTESQGPMEGELAFRSELFDRGTIERMGRHFRNFLEQVADGSNLPVSEIALLSYEERDQLLRSCNGSGREYAFNRTIADLFEEQAAKTPHSVAVVSGPATLTYKDLNDQANRIAHYLTGQGVGEETLVGILMERSGEMIVALLGVLKAGAAYVPMDTGSPRDRLRYMLEDAGVGWLLTEERLLQDLGDSVHARTLCPDRDLTAMAPQQGGNPVRRARAENLAYVIYTSGSTGRPKGATVTHANVQRLLAATESLFHFSAGDTWTLFHSYAFDFSVWEIWGALLYGGRLVVVPYWISRSPEEFRELLEREHVTILNQTPSAFRQLAEADGRTGQTKLESLRVVIFGGEALDVRILQPWWERYGDSNPALINMYGITETTVHVTWKRLRETELQTRRPGSPIGIPIDDLRVYVLEPSGEPAPPGVCGELYVGGAGVSRGYLKRPELTAQRFVPDGFSGAEGARLYRTGDLARRRESGELDYLGRIDHQIKIRGFRIELGEIEALLDAHAGVKESVVVAWQEVEDTCLVGYVVLDGGTQVTTRELRKYLLGKMPEYMVPAALLELDKLPLTTNGKLDRAALPRPQLQDAAGYVAPRTVTEELIANLWAEVLGKDRISAESNFFEMGGHSLLATRVTLRLRELFRIELSLRDFFDKPTVALLARQIEQSQGMNVGLQAPSLSVQARSTNVPLSFAQERIWFLEQLEPDTSANNIPIALAFHGPLSVISLEQAIAGIASRHESLRTVFIEADGQPAQKILPLQRWRMPVVDLSGRRPEDVERMRAWITSREADRVFDLNQGPLFRNILLRLGADHHILLLTMHHIVSDGWSLGVYSRELTALYQDFAAGGPSSLPPLVIQYADYCYWQRKWIQGDVLREHLSYWHQQLASEPPVLELPTDHPRPDIRTTRGASHAFTFSEELALGVQRISTASGSTRFMTLFSGFLTLLHRYSGQTDLCVGTFIANRNRSEAENLIGFFVNNLVLRVDIGRRPSFRELLGRVRKVTLDAYAHQDLPFEKILEDLRPARSQKHTPLFQTMFVLQNTPLARFEARGIQVTVLPVENTRSNFDITLWVEEREGLQASVQYNADLFDPITIERMSKHLCRLLDGAVSDQDRKISELPLLSPNERSQILDRWNATARTYDENRPVHRLFEEQVERSPMATAVVFGEERVTYAELNQRANRVAHALLCFGAGPEHLTGLMAERSIEMIAGLLGILKAGCGYVPLDPRLPAERLHYILQDSGAFLLLTQSRLMHLAPGGMRAVALDGADGLQHCPVTNPASAVGGGNAAYVIYTSGSTGTPKGVLIEHHSLLNHTLAAIRHYDLSASDRVLQFASLSFDASAEEIYPCLLTGGTLVLRTDEMLASPPAFLQACDRWQITVLDLPTAYWHALAAGLATDIPSLPSSLRLTILGGERALPQRAFSWVQAGSPGAKLVNSYGPTEATIVATYCDVTESLRTAVPAELAIGQPIANVRTYVLDEHLEPVPLGVAGQLHVAGAGLARQYLRRPDLTAEKFIPDPFSIEPGGVLYKTGDYVRQLRDGCLEFVGRADRQIKIRGNRIELSEIEARLSKYPGVREAAVIPRKDSDGELYLAAYLVCDAETQPEMAEVRTFLRMKLPEYMIPAAILCIDQMPLTSAGKLDASRLPAPSGARPDLAREFVAPRTLTEEILAGIWSEVLRVPRVSMTDSFFDLGGYSLLATQVLARTRDVFSVDLPLHALFEAKTLEELATQIAEATRITVPRIERVSRDGDLPLSFAQERVWFLTQLDRTISSYHVPRATRATGYLNATALRHSYTAMVERHEILRTTFPAIEGRPVQRIGRPWRVPIPVVDLSNLAEDRKNALLSELILQAGRQLFDIEHGPLLRVRLVRMSERENVIVQTEHHLVHDGWAEGVLTRDLLAFYSAYTNGQPPELPSLPIQFADFAAWQKNWMTGQVLKSQLTFWKETLAGAPPLLNLPTDHPRPAVQTFRGAEEEMFLPIRTIETLREISRREGATLFMTACAAYLALLHRYSGQEDLVLGTVIANRSQHQTEGLLGMILNTLPLRTSLDGDPTFRQVLARVRQACLMAYAHQDVPFEKLVDAVRPERNLSYSPVFQVMFAFHDAPRPNMNLPGLRLQSIDAHNRSAKFDMLVISSTAADGMTSLFEYNTDLFEPATIQRFVRQYSRILEALPSTLDTKLSELEYLSQEELFRLTHEFNDVAERFDDSVCLHQMFEAQAERSREAVALVTAAGRLSYGDLNRCANRLARRLRERGIGPEQRVAIYSNRSAEMIVGILAVLKSGGAYVPIDPAYPAERQKFILADSGARVVLMQRSLMERLPKTDVSQEILDDAILAGPSDDGLENPPAACTPASIAYLIYTSGSTGIPKGVAIEHRSAVAMVHWARKVFTPEEFAGTLASTSICFDLSIFELFLPLSWGGRVLLVENALQLSSPWLEGEVTLVNTVPSGIAEIVSSSGLPQSVRTVCLAGEPLRGELVKQLYKYRQVRRVFNLYGPSEATTYSTFSLIPSNEDREPSIGAPVTNTRVYVLDAGLRPMPIGVPGELMIGGAGVARGYLGRPELTARQFVPDPFGEPGSRLYRTGDLAKWNASGFLEFLGRIDHQVKIRGYRIEPGEIEAALRANAAIKDCAVIPWQGTPNELRLAAYVVMSHSGAITELDLRDYLRTRLPDYMVPFAFVFLDSLPLTPNGKLDRKALPALQSAAAAAAGREVMLPASALERTIASIWKEVLGREDVGAQSNFFDLGGHSLLLMRIHHRLQKDMRLSLELIDLFKYPTVESLANHLAGRSQAPTQIATIVQAAADVSEHSIAIVGMFGRFPGADDIGQFWKNLCAGVDSISRFSVEELETAGIDQDLLSDPNYVRAKGIIEGVEWFDAEFFDYSPREAEIMDPQQRLFLEGAWAALENAGYDPLRYPGAIGVYAGCGMSSYWFNLYSNPEIVKLVTPYQAKLGNDKDYLATRVSYKLNLRGPAINVQTACSTSLVAVHLACRSLIQGECDMALAGGVSVVAQQKSGYLFHEGGIHSPDGVCRAFDESAQGTVGGNGLGIVVLKRLSAAQAAGDHIYAVIKGTALDNDGSGKIGYTAPGIEGQARVIAQAAAWAGVDPSTISYVETHGTGTVLGDPIEMAALNEAFSPYSMPLRSCAIGSLKTNIGHLDAAAGVAGLMKTALALKHRRIPPSLNYMQANTKIDFDHGPFFVNTRLKDWDGASGPRRAGVSSFGIGGTNAHAVLEEAPSQEAATASRPWQLLLLSARTAPALDALTEQLHVFLKQHPDVPLADVAYTLQVGRRTFRHRRLLVCGDRDEAIEILAGDKPEHLVTGVPVPQGLRLLTFLFPGGGSQRVNMGLDLYRFENTFRQVTDECAKLFEPYLGFDLRDVLYPGEENIDAATQQLNGVTLSLASTFALECALAAQWMEWGIVPAAMLGHSLGEYVAAYLAGVFSLADAVRLVSARGSLIGETAPGAMISVPMSERDIQPFLKDGLCIAAINSGDQCVIAGPVRAVDELEQKLKSADISVNRLRIDRASHCSLLDPVLGRFAETTRLIQYRAPRIPFISGVTGTWITDEQATDPEYWVRHMRQPVQFDAGLNEIFRDSGRVLLEAGPGRTLASIAYRNPGRAADAPVFSSLRSVAGQLSEGASGLEALGRAWLAGVNPDWEEFYRHERRMRVPIPGYPFERQYYWIKPGELTAASAATGKSFAKKKDIADWFYVRSWRCSAPPPRCAAKGPERWLVFADDSALTRRLIELLRQCDQEVTEVESGDDFVQLGAGHYRIDPRSQEHHRRLIEEIGRSGWVPHRVVHAWALRPDRETGPREDDFDSFHSVLWLAQSICRIQPAESLRLDILSTGLQAVKGRDRVIPEKAAILGLARVISQEFPNIACGNIDIDPPGIHGAIEERLADSLLRELFSSGGNRYVAYRDQARWLEEFEPIRLSDAESGRSALRRQGTYLILGGLGRIGLTLAGFLAKEFHARLVLVQRTPLSEADRVDDPTQTVQAVRELEKEGGEVLVLSANLADESRMRDVIEQTIARFGALHGVIHCAGAVGEQAYRSLEETGDVVLERQFEAKVHGLRILEKVLKGVVVDFCLLSSSLSSVLGGLGYCAYAAANSFIDAFVQQTPQPSGVRWMSLNWDAWTWQKEAARSQGPGVGISRLSILPEEGVEVFQRALAVIDIPQLLVSTSDLRQRMETWTSGLPPTAVPEAATVATHARPVLGTQYVAPRTETEEAIAQVLQQLLGVQQIGIHDSFYALGGDSLLATQAVARLRRRLNVSIQLRNFLQKPTIAALAEALQSNAHAVQPALNVDATPLHASLTIDQELEELSNLSDEQVQALIRGNAAIQR